MTPLTLLFFVSLLFGQLTGLSVAPGVTVYLHDVVLVLLLAVAGVKLLTKPFRRPKLLPAIVGFTGISLVSLFVNASKFAPAEVIQSGMYAVRWFTYALLYIVVAARIVPVGVWLWGLYGTGVGLAVLGLFQYVLYPSLQNLSYLGWDPHYYRVFSTLLDPNFAGILFVFTLCLGLGLWNIQKNNRWWLIFFEGITLLALLLTYSRSSYVALLASVLIWIIMQRKWKWGALGMAAFVLAILLLPQHGLDVLRLTRLDSTVARIGNWKESVVVIRQSPVLGHGFNTLRFLREHGREIGDGVIISKAGAGMDSSILFVAATTGLVGLGFYGWLWYSAITLVGRLRTKAMSPLAQAYLMTLVALFVHSLFVDSAFYPWVMLWVWVLVGVIESISDTPLSAPRSFGSRRRRWQRL